MGYVITVSGAVGGIGTSTLAYAIALQAAAPRVLLDGQIDGAPLDVTLGAEAVSGARWSQVRVQSDAIDVGSVLTALPALHGVHLLSADRDGWADPRAVTHLVNALRDACSVVVLDLPMRQPLAQALDADLHVLAMPPTIPGIGSALLASQRPLQVVVVETGHADIPSGSLIDYMDHPIAGVVRWQRGVTLAAAACQPPPAGSDVMRVAGSIWAGLHHDA